MVGAINRGDEEVLGRMSAAKAHRGPDDADHWESRLPDVTWAGLDNRRLVMIDLSTPGHRSKSNEERDFWKSYNVVVCTFQDSWRGMGKVSQSELNFNLTTKPATGLVNLMDSRRKNP